LLGFVEAVEPDGEIPLILKINAHDLLHGEKMVLAQPE